MFLISKIILQIIVAASSTGGAIGFSFITVKNKLKRGEKIEIAKNYYSKIKDHISVKDSELNQLNFLAQTMPIELETLGQKIVELRSELRLKKDHFKEVQDELEKAKIFYTNAQSEYKLANELLNNKKDQKAALIKNVEDLRAKLTNCKNCYDELIDEEIQELDFEFCIREEKKSLEKDLEAARKEINAFSIIDSVRHRQEKYKIFSFAFYELSRIKDLLQEAKKEVKITEEKIHELKTKKIWLEKEFEETIIKIENVKEELELSSNKAKNTSQEIKNFSNRYI